MRFKQEGGSHADILGRAFQVEEIAGAKALRWELGRRGGGTTRSPV